jgi:phosphoribosylglycinamide formyltransferase-1
MARLKTAILISGRGSNNVPDAAGLKFAEDAGIPCATIDHRQFPDRESFEQEITSCLTDADVGLICLAGFMRLLTASFVNAWRDRLINIHPSLLPAYKGLDTHARVLADGVRFTGCTVHFVRPKMDAGPIIVQAAVPVASDDDANSLARRVLEAEHQIYPLALQYIAEGRVSISNELVRIEGAHSPMFRVVNPE